MPVALYLHVSLLSHQIRFYHMHACILIVAEQVTVMDFTLELMDSEEAMVTLNVPYSVSIMLCCVHHTCII